MQTGTGGSIKAAKARWQRIAALIVLCLITQLGVAWAQSATTGAIAGQIKDMTGGVLPGVTVEASSPALIEKVRAAVADAEGIYKIVDLRPGVYTVTFRLQGFSTLRRDGIQLNAGFTANVDAEMPLGTVDETLTVTGTSPIVDTQNVGAQNVLTREILDSVPTAKNVAGFGALTLGAVSVRDVGGNAGDRSGRMRIHGSRADGITTFDGLNLLGPKGEGDRRIHANQMAVQEITLQTGGMNAEAESGGVTAHIIPKEGGNAFRGVFNIDYTGKGLQSSNLSDDLRARGLTRTNRIRHIYDVGAGFGGKIKADKLWFYVAPRKWGAEEELAGVYYNKLQGTLFYEPDLSRPAYNTYPVREFVNVRLTWQAAQKHKIAFTVIDQENCSCFALLGVTRAPEAAWVGILTERLVQGTWTFPATSRLLFEAAGVWRDDSGEGIYGDSVTKDHRAVQELSTNMWYGSVVSGANPTLYTADGWLVDYGKQLGRFYNTRTAVSYVTGSHSFKTGFTTYSGVQDGGPGTPNFNEVYQFRNRVPVGLYQLAGPGYWRTRVKINLGVFAQDQWTIDRFTLNLGLRFDYLNAYNPAQSRPAGSYTPEFHWDPVYNVPNWKDVSPRLGLAYDLFGNGKTAVKVYLGRYMSTMLTRIAQQTNPSEAITGTVHRTWEDRNGNYVPDCELKSPLGNGECGPMADERFGTPVVTLRYDPDYLNGWGDRGYSWQGSASVQHELTSGVAVSLGYFRTWYGNFEATDNLPVSPADYDPFCITAPVDARLPSGGGYQVCGYDLKPSKFGQVERLVTKASAYGKQTETFNGVDVGINARFAGSGLFFGGVSTGKTVVDKCYVVDSPDLRFCRTEDTQAQIKLAGSYPLPWWRLQASATFQSLPGVNRLASYVATNAQIFPSLGRNLGACGTRPTCNASVVLNLIEPNRTREPRQSQLDVRLSTSVRIGRVRLQPKFDVYNLLNSSDVLIMNTRHGPAWLNANSILAARTFKFGTQVDF